MRLSNLADYAVLLMSAAARQCGAHMTIGRLSARQLSDQTGIPLPTAQKLVSRLVAADLLDSARGSGGGIRLSRPPAAISLARIVEAVDGPIAITPCLESDKAPCALEANCTVQPHWPIVNTAIRSALEAVSLADLARTPAHMRPTPSSETVEAQA